MPRSSRTGLRSELKIHYVSHIEEVLALALTPGAAQTHSGLPLDQEIQEAVQSGVVS